MPFIPPITPPDDIAAPITRTIGDREYKITNPQQCGAESPCWGWEAEGERCQRTEGHLPPHYLEYEHSLEGRGRMIWERIET